MNTHFLSIKDISTIRRLDYMIKGTDPMKSGYLYGAFLKMSLSIYNDPNLTDETKSAQFEFNKAILKEKLDWVNDWMITNNREIIFTDITDWHSNGADYDYFWELRTEDQFAIEEAKARLGLSSQIPVNLDFDSTPREHNSRLRELIVNYEQELKQGMTSSLE